MAIKIVTDIHGEYDALLAQLEPEDTAVMLGDYLNLIDFRTLGGILAEVYPLEDIVKALAALAKGGRDMARRSIREIASSDDEKPRRVRELMMESYRRLFDSLPCRCLAIYGNTDSPQMMRELSGENVEVVEKGVFDLDGTRFGLISGTPLGSWTVGLPGEMDVEAYNGLVESLGPVDVLCTHYPPAVPDLTWDTVANRDEEGSAALLDYIERHRPGHHYFGHVHNPRSSRATRGETRLINAGFFREHREVVVHRP